MTTTTIILRMKSQAFGSVAVVTKRGWFRKTTTQTLDCVKGPTYDDDAQWADKQTGHLVDFDLMDKINNAADELRAVTQ